MLKPIILEPILHKIILILQLFSSGNQLVSLIQIRSSYSSLILVNHIFQLNSIVCDLPNFQCFPASLIQANFAFVPFTFPFLFSPKLVTFCLTKPISSNGIRAEPWFGLITFALPIHKWWLLKQHCWEGKHIFYRSPASA